MTPRWSTTVVDSTATAPAATAIGQPNAAAIIFFLIFISITLFITRWAARRTRTVEQFYVAGGTLNSWQN